MCIEAIKVLNGRMKGEYPEVKHQQLCRVSEKRRHLVRKGRRQEEGTAKGVLRTQMSSVVLRPIPGTYPPPRERKAQAYSLGMGRVGRSFPSWR